MSRREKELPPAAKRRILENAARVDAFLSLLLERDFDDRIRLGVVDAKVGGGRFRVKLVRIPGAFEEIHIPKPVSISGSLEIPGKAAQYEDVELSVYPGRYVIVRQLVGMGKLGTGPTHEIVGVIPTEDARAVMGSLGIPEETAEEDNIGAFVFNREEANAAVREARDRLHAEYERELTAARRRSSSTALSSSAPLLSNRSSEESISEHSALRSSERERRKRAKQTRRKERRKAGAAGGTQR